ncbi:hypothetical protein [Streptomyces sp. NPDC051776]|uniref:hypothetical protein n=1 Tax=Streptomyces sp. NPDC051776 TaxID=3155414 RepID=UPI0034179FD4
MPLSTPSRPSSGPDSEPGPGLPGTGLEAGPGAGPDPDSARPAGGPRRRSLLAGALGATAAAAVLSGCSDSGSAAERAERTDKALRLRDRGAADSKALLARYDATVRAHPPLAPRLVPLRAEVARHADALLTPRSGSASPSASASREDRPRAPEISSDEGEALAALAEAERRTADARTAALMGAPPELARLLASIAASGAGHAYLLTKGA